MSTLTIVRSYAWSGYGSRVCSRRTFPPWTVTLRQQIIVDTEINEFNSVNDWNSSDFDEPTVFRRIKCPDESPLREQPGNVAPPAFYPKAKKSTGGC